MVKARVLLILASGIFFVVIVINGFAQNNQTESLTIATYFPAPYGVYKNPRLVPLTDPPCSGSDCAGTIYFNNSDKQLYIHNGSNWNTVGSGGSGNSGLVIDSDHLVSADLCNDKIFSFWGKNQVCDYDGWYKNILFKKHFNSTPQVIVVQEINPDNINSPCTDNMTTGFKIYAENIKTTGFLLQAGGGSSYWSRCNEGGGNLKLCDGENCDGKVKRILVGWIAIGQ